MHRRNDILSGPRHDPCQIRRPRSLLGTALPLLSIGLLLLLPHKRADAQDQPATPHGGTIHGIVKSGNMPIPGATVSIISAGSATDKISVWTEVDGSYSASVPAFGSYTVRVQMAAFASNAQHVIVDSSHPNTLANFELSLLSRTRQAGSEPRRAGAGTVGPRGFQSLALAQSGGASPESNGDPMAELVPSGMPVPGIAPTAQPSQSRFPEVHRIPSPRSIMTTLNNAATTLAKQEAASEVRAVLAAEPAASGVGGVVEAVEVAEALAAAGSI